MHWGAGRKDSLERSERNGFVLFKSGSEELGDRKPLGDSPNGWVSSDG